MADVYFKASTKKNHKELSFAPTNLHLQRMTVFNTLLQTSKGYSFLHYGSLLNIVVPNVPVRHC